MRILLSTYGSRGDVEPIVALAAALQAAGAEAVVCAPADPEFLAVTDRAGVTFTPAFAPVRQWVTEAMKDKESFDLPTRAGQIAAAQYEAISAAADGCDAVLATGLFPSMAAAQAVAEARGLPFVAATYCPIWWPSEHHAPHPFPGHPLPSGVTDNRLLWEHNIETKTAIFGGGVNRMREAAGLAPVDNVRDHVFTDRPWLASDPVLSPWKPTDLREVVQTGAWILPDDRPLPADLEAFLQAGPPPVYVGFGSMPMAALKDAARAAVEVVRAHGRRALLLHGWADLALSDDRDDCFIVGDVNQQALFARVEAVVHHGGAGTTTAAARAGAPQVIVPQIGDQPYWAERVAALGVGARHDGPAPTVESLSAALATALTPATQVRAAAVAGRVQGDGAAQAAKRLLETVAG